MQNYQTSSGIVISQYTTNLQYQGGLDHLLDALDSHRGMYLSSGIEYPGRYSRWDFGFIDPPLELIAIDRQVHVQALNPRGVILLQILKPFFLNAAAVKKLSDTPHDLRLEVLPSHEQVPEEWRSRQPTVFTPLQAVLAELSVIQDSAFGFYGAFGHELIFQFDPIQLSFARQGHEKLFHLFLVDDLYVMDRRKETLQRLSLEWKFKHYNTEGAMTEMFKPLKSDSGMVKSGTEIHVDVNDGEYAQRVEQAQKRMRVGDIFEVVLSREFKVDFSGSKAQIFRRMQQQNPSPYELFCQFGDEQLVGTSPEMFVRVSGKRIESCPISGTIRRGKNAMEDEANIRTLLNSSKDEVELTMCTDVDRNDKARLCEPGSVKLLARRTIERYTGLFHTVDHVEGTLCSEFNGLDGFLSHMWAVTLTGAPKKKAVQIIEEIEQTCRHWYGGAVGRLSFNTDVNTCITIRTLHFKNNQARYRVGATLVWDSIGMEESQETILKATPFRRVLDLEATPQATSTVIPQIGCGYRAIMIDNEDSFVHTLSSYFRQFGMEVITYRAGIDLSLILQAKPHLVIHSPGPGWPKEFGVPALVSALAQQGIPQFGVCLGLQGIIEAFGGKLKLLDIPRHGKTWHLSHQGQGILAGIPSNCIVGAYHSIVADKTALPECLEVIAENEQGDVMAVMHRHLPVQAVQFHPESILSMQNQVGLAMIKNVIQQLVIGSPL